ncbi:type II toxin-antitoxin system HicB family antitoxin [Levilactobacillus brevis]|uniref:Type II toxin-antitoxin system HicB family antitoxin n=1 Tax=Levilactobacillus brevis TaxID=1580 RepID=A0AB38X798_LEVBR|nr:type II toxin-antitoxin system HicB family antitoxin [Levilactobacillus brevis]MCB5232554.1 type II toxin-antitoxin system HicB family antitoxin [Levilactobacillus brevis]MCE6011367.1 type II toxin-antitoxin system HicB family antitoxin [Levilactobacillus brevis]MCE6013655.1 type II toxin-antitoxin system HicB family antitoxin [Levilactobacillus brevis]MCE6016047.1 type II toxin-antitoxin system HicB family antitoxin [Levilactobacillus brevis]MCE6018481.1 type II toxin-antitoxin system HicB
MTKSNIVTYPAVFHDNEVGGYTVTFPDIEDATTSGQTLGESLVNAAIVLGQTLHDQPTVLPSATTITELMHQYPMAFIQFVAVDLNQVIESAVPTDQVDLQLIQ